jgi:hypothetical protein
VEHLSRTAWRAKRENLLDRFVKEYRKPEGSRSNYYSLQAPNDAAVSLMEARKKASRLWISGDVAADLLAPHSRPTRLLVYTFDSNLRLPVDWVEAAGPQDGNIEIVGCMDESVATFPLERAFKGTSVTLADPTQVLWDLHATGVDDRMEAAEKVRAWILNSRYAS